MTVRFLAASLSVLLAVPAASQQLTPPERALGFAIGADYRLATYTQFESWWRTLDRESDRMVLQEIGKTAEGRPQLMAIVTSPENHRRLDRYREIARRLALAQDADSAAARQLAVEGKAVVWIDGGLHATEVLGASQLMETVWQLLSRNDAETMRILNDVVILAVHANPDGMELVSSWYMREPDSLKRRSGTIPRLYQKYIGHDNNRDFYALTQPESQNMARVLFTEWYPQIMYNHHQTGPAGAVLFAPPFRDPHNYWYDPLVPLGIAAVGAAMHGRFVAEDKPGATMRSGAGYSTWWNGGLRTTVYFHNQIGLLTETIGNPTPVDIPFVPSRQLASGDMPYPVAPQRWHFRRSVDYSITANYAVLDYASRYRETLLMNIWRMGRNSIERGSRDTWTVRPTMVAAVEAAGRDSARQAGGGGGGGGRTLPARFFERLHDPALRDPRGYILPADQADFPTTVKFVNALIRAGVTVHRATAEFTVAGKRYPAGSLVIKTAQPFRPHVLDMFEPQDHPNDFQYPGGPPIAPYDNAGWTLAFQMGVKFDRVLDGFDGPFEPVPGLLAPPAATVAQGSAGFLLDPRQNDAVIVVNRLLAAKQEVFRLAAALPAPASMPAGAYWIPARRGVQPILDRGARELGVRARGVSQAPRGAMGRVNPVRIGLWDRYGGSMPSGWTRWLLEQFEFPYELVYPKGLDAGRLADRFDVIVLPDGAVPALRGAGGGGGGGGGPEGGGGGGGGQPDSTSVPAEFRPWLGQITAERTVPELRRFIEAGGTVIAVGSSVNLGYHLGLPVSSQLTDSAGRALPREKFYVPGSVLEVAVDTTRALAWGMGSRADVFFDESPVLRLAADAGARGVRPVSWYASPAPLRSGWAWGQQYLNGGVAAAEADVGSGKLFLFAPEILFRGQPHGTFKLFFNALLAGAAPSTGASR